MTEPILRRACDRCHSQKLSCQRDKSDSTGSCARCLKANTPCSTSPSQRNRRSRPLPRRTSTPLRTDLDSNRDAIARDTWSRSLSNVDGDRGGAGMIHDGFHNAINDMLQTPTDGPLRLRPSPSVETIDWMDMAAQTPRSLASLDWTNGNLNPFSVADLDLLNQDLGIVTPLMSPEHRREGDLLFGLGNAAAPSSRSIPIPPTAAPRAGPSNASASDQPSEPSPGIFGRSGQADGQWLQKVVEINVQLFNHANKAKADFSGSNSDASSQQEGSAPFIRRPAGFNAFDETIVLSFYLVKALHSLYSPDSLKLFDHSPIPVSLPSSLDSGTTLIILSCYIRVLDLFMDRLGAMKTALHSPSTSMMAPSPTVTMASTREANASASTESSPGPNGPSLLLPTLIACGCPLEGYPVLRLRMTLELIEEVLDVMSALVSPIVHGIGSQSQSGQSSLMPDVSPQALSAREQAAYRTIKEIRTELKSHRRIMVI